MISSERTEVFSIPSRMSSTKLPAYLLTLGHDQAAVDELGGEPFEAEMSWFYGLAIDAKSFYLYLLAKQGDPSVRIAWAKFPMHYRHITMDGTFLAKRTLPPRWQDVEGEGYSVSRHHQEASMSHLALARFELRTRWPAIPCSADGRGQNGR